MISRADAIQTILQLTPEFRPAWEAYLADWNGKTPGACLDFGEYSHFIDDAVLHKRTVDLAAVFAFIERCLDEGDEDVQNAASVCFLENLLNRETPTQAWVHFLGPRSLEFCREWGYDGN
ncbi:MAG TPA: hypothetical protein V6D47_12530 [Oscillatoriaceae cyanobacterium]